MAGRPMRLAEFERMDMQGQFEVMMESLQSDNGDVYLKHMILSRSLFGPYNIEQTEQFKVSTDERYRALVEEYKAGPGKMFSEMIIANSKLCEAAADFDKKQNKAQEPEGDTSDIP